MTTYPQPEWFADMPRQFAEWSRLVAHRDYTGLFRPCADADIAWEIQTCWHMMLTFDRLGMLRSMPRFSDAEAAKTADYLCSLQDPATGVFADPNIEPRLAWRNDPDRMRVYRISNAARVVGMLRFLGREPQYPVPALPAGEQGIDRDFIMGYVKGLDWRHPWAACSHAGAFVRTLHEAVEGGDAAARPVLEEVLAFVLSQQDPATGMWGLGADLPAFEKLSGTLKILIPLRDHVGLVPPHMDRIADSCILWHDSKRLYTESLNHCIPRNLSEVALVCLEQSDYRAEDLRRILAEAVEYQHREWQTPDGGFSMERGGGEAVHTMGVVVAPAVNVPRGIVSGFNAMIHHAGTAAAGLGWDQTIIPRPDAAWRERVARNRFAVRIDRARVRLEPK